jgi:hypothetical protein
MKSGYCRPSLMHGLFLLVSLAPGLGALSLEEALARLDRTSGVRTALLAVQSTEKNLQSLRFAGDPTFTLGPQVKATAREWEPFAEEVALSAAATANFPLGLSAAEKERVRAAAGLELEVLAAERNAAPAYADALNERFRAGEISLLELAFTVEWELAEETPQLPPESLLAETAALPRPSALVSWALERDPESSALQAELARLEESLARPRKGDTAAATSDKDAKVVADAAGALDTTHRPSSNCASSPLSNTACMIRMI